MKPLGHQRDPEVILVVVQRGCALTTTLYTQAPVAEENASLSSEDFYAKCKAQILFFVPNTQPRRLVSHASLLPEPGALNEQVRADEPARHHPRRDQKSEILQGLAERRVPREKFRPYDGSG